MSGYILPYQGVMPTIATDAFIAPNATVIGNVTIGSQSSVWFNTVIRGDVMSISIGERTNLQDGTIVHVTGGMFDTVIGSDVLIGHRAIVHGATLEDGCFVGMAATILDGAVVETGALVAAGAMVTPGSGSNGVNSGPEAQQSFSAKSMKQNSKSLQMVRRATVNWAKITRKLLKKYPI